MRVTPWQAGVWLRDSDVGHKLDPRTIRDRRMEMEAGSFLPDPPVKLHRNGLLHDGRHRLYALVLYGRPVEISVEVID